MKMLAGGLALALASVSAHAADLPRVEKSPSAQSLAVPGQSWTGFYVGINGGWGRNIDGVNFWPATFDATGYFTQAAIPYAVNGHAEGGLIGIQFGQNWRWGTNWVVGIEADLDWADISGGGSVHTTVNGFMPFTTTGNQHLGWFGTARTRFGYAWDRAWVYATGGLAFGRTELNTVIRTDGVCGPGGLCAVASTSEWRTGWTVGAGLEWALIPGWSVKAEYLYYDLGRVSHLSSDPAVTIEQIVFGSSSNFRGSIVRAGLNFAFGGPVIAKY